MIGKVVKRRRGGATRLLAYLYREGPAGEKGLCSAHVNPRMVGSWDGDPAALEPPIAPAGWRDYMRLVQLLEQPIRAAGLPDDAKPVYHLVLAAKKDEVTGKLVDRYLSDEQWGDIAAEYMHQLGLAPRGDPNGIRWVAIRHADDHVHVVATLARLDGKRVSPHNDFYRSREASNFIERKYGLTPTSPGDRTGETHPSRGEREKARTASDRTATAPPHRAQRRRQPTRVILRRRVRVAAAATTDVDSFAARLRADHVLVRLRMSERNPGQVTGYAVALSTDVDSAGNAIYFGGGKLATDLTLPKLQRRWDITPANAGAAGAGSGDRVGDGPGEDAHRAHRREHRRAGLSPEERHRMWEQVIAAAARATREVAAARSGGNADAGGDAAWAGADFLAAAARLVEGRRGGPLTAAAEEYQRAALELWGRFPRQRYAARDLRSGARLLLAARTLESGDTRRLLELLARMIAFTEAVARLRDTQQRAAQAAAARRAAERLRGCQTAYGTPGFTRHRSTSTTTGDHSADVRRTWADEGLERAVRAGR